MTGADSSRDGRLATLSGVGGLLAALGAVATWFCCLPIAAGAAGALAGIAGAAWGLRPWLLGIAVLCLAFGFWRAYRPARCADGAPCAPLATRRRARAVVWLAAAVVLLAWTFPTWSAWLAYALL